MSTPASRMRSSASRMTVSVRKPRKSILSRPKLLDGAHRELGGDDLVVALERHIIGDGLVGDEHARRVGGGMAGQAFERAAGVDQPLDARVLLIVLFQPGEISSARASVMFSSKGIDLETASTSGYG